MPYYSEAETKELRLKVEEVVLAWPDVVKKTMFGSPGYVVGKTYFAMMVTGGIILTRLGEEEKERLLADPRTGYFEGHGRVMKKWVRISLPDPQALEQYIPYIRSSYEIARDEAG